MAAQRIAARPPSALSGSVGINAISPRRRGRRSRFSAQAPICSFASPLTRGRRRAQGRRRGPHRLIPAHAGSTRDPERNQIMAKAHPRSRGVDTAELVRRDDPDGSSPLTRGRQGPTRHRRRRSRLIPAHAGSTIRLRRGRVGNKAHPRSRGVDGPVLFLLNFGDGSSPLTRGRRVRASEYRPDRRLIPAHAGSTRASASAPTLTTAHPRSRGVDHDQGQGGGGLRGSSPLTRGRRTTARVIEGVAGLIPAHAGSTVKTGRAGSRAPAHPRSRGVDSKGDRLPARPDGSSPLTRGRRRAKAAPHA